MLSRHGTSCRLSSFRRNDRDQHCELSLSVSTSAATSIDDPHTPDPDPVAATPTPMPTDVHMARRRRDHYLLDEGRRHRSHRDPHIVAVLPVPSALVPRVMPRNPVVVHSRRRGSYLHHRGRRLAVNDARRRLVNNGGARSKADGKQDECAQRAAACHFGLLHWFIGLGIQGPLQSAARSSDRIRDART